MIKLAIKPHSILEGDLIEITKDGELLATVTVNEPSGEVRVLTKHFKRVTVESSDYDPESVLTVVRVFLKRKGSNE